MIYDNIKTIRKSVKEIFKTLLEQSSDYPYVIKTNNKNDAELIVEMCEENGWMKAFIVNLSYKEIQYYEVYVELCYELYKEKNGI